MVNSGETVEELEVRYKGLVTKRENLQRDKDKIEAESSARKRALKEKLNAAREEGFDPENLPQEIQRAKEVIALKLDTFAADLEEAERKMKPMKAAIEGG
jgi:chaperonin cofactor prefoldin